MVLAGKAYRSPKLRKDWASIRIKVGISPESNKKSLIYFDKRLYRLRSKVDNLFSPNQRLAGVPFSAHRYATSFQCASLALISLFFYIEKVWIST